MKITSALIRLRAFFLQPVRSSLSISWLWLVFQVVFAIFILYWLKHLPVPGIAVGALGLLAVLTTFEENTSRLQRAIWIVVAFALLFIEGQAINKDRVDNQGDQAEIRAVDQLRFLRTTASLKATLDAARQSFDSAEKSRLNTIPRANIELLQLLSNIASGLGPMQMAQLAFVGEKPLGINAFFRNTGSGSATNGWSFLKLYVDTPVSPDAERRIAKLFEADWKASPHKAMGAMGPNSNQFWQTFFQTLTQKDWEGLQAGNKTVYFIFRTLYEDQTGSWYQDNCGQFQEPLQNRGIVQACSVILSAKHPVTSADYKKYAHAN
jgi:hypothetical protein